MIFGASRFRANPPEVPFCPLSSRSYDVLPAGKHRPNLYGCYFSEGQDLLYEGGERHVPPPPDRSPSCRPAGDAVEHRQSQQIQAAISVEENAVSPDTWSEWSSGWASAPTVNCHLASGPRVGRPKPRPAADWSGIPSLLSQGPAVRLRSPVASVCCRSVSSDSPPTTRMSSGAIVSSCATRGRASSSRP